MRLDVFPSEKEQEWNGLIAELGDSLHHSNRLTNLATGGCGGIRSIQLLLKSDDKALIGAALAFVSKSRFGLGTCLWTEAVPLVQGESEKNVRLFLEYLERFSKKNGVHIINIGSFGYSYGAKALTEAGYILKKRFEFILRIKDRTESDVFANLNQRKRRYVRSAERKGIVVREESNIEGLSALLEVQQDSSRRITKRGGPDISYKGTAKDHPAYSAMTSGVLRLFVARHKETPMSAIACAYAAGKVFAVLSGHSQEGLKFQSGAISWWYAIKTFMSEGTHEFNLGGCSAEAEQESSPEHGVFKFKSLFGAECVECFGGSRVLKPHSLAAIQWVRRVLGRPCLVY